MIKVYEIKKDGYEPFIDFLKGLCILCVIWEHGMPFLRETLFYFWGKMAVPIFLVIQCFHVFKRNLFFCPSFSKLYKRILKPFFIVSLLILMIKYILGDFLLSDMSFWLKALKSGGWGPGCYFPWIYIQFAILAPVIYRLLQGKSNKFQISSILIGSIVTEVVFTYMGGEEWLWRILAIRYLFLMTISFSLCKSHIRLTKTNMVLSIIGLFFIALFEYEDFSYTPLFFDSACNWKSTHWVCFLYLFLLIFFIRMRYEKSSGFMKVAISYLGKASFEIFLVQMIIFSTIDEHVTEIIDGLRLHGWLGLFYYLAIWLICLGMGILIYRLKNRKTSTFVYN